MKWNALDMMFKGSLGEKLPWCGCWEELRRAETRWQELRRAEKRWKEFKFCTTSTCSFWKKSRTKKLAFHIQSAAFWRRCRTKTFFAACLDKYCLRYSGCSKFECYAGLKMDREGLLRDGFEVKGSRSDRLPKWKWCCTGFPMLSCPPGSLVCLQLSAWASPWLHQCCSMFLLHV